MSELITRVAKLVPYSKRPKALSGIATAFMFEPEVIGDQNFGSLFVVLEVLGTSKQAHEVSDLIIQTAGHSYYNQALPTPTDSKEPAHLQRFEAAIKAVNTQLTKYLASGHSSWVGKLSAVIAVICEGELQISQAGSVEINLYRASRTTRLSHSPSASEKSSDQTFPSIANGQLQASDKLVFATPALLHHLSVAELKNYVHDSSPNGAIHKIHERLSGSNQAERVAMLVVEVTTPELASLHTLSTESNEVELGAPSSPLEAAKIAAAPAAEAAAGFTGRLLVRFGRFFKDRVLPLLKRGLIKIVSSLRGWLGNRKHHKYLLIGAFTIILGVFYLNYMRLQTQSLNRLKSRYLTTLESEQQAEKQMTHNDQVGARKTLKVAKQQITTLRGEPLAPKLDLLLKKSSHAEYDPASLAGLAALIDSKIDLVDGLTKSKTTLVTNFSALTGAAPNYFELVAGKAYFYDNRATSIYIYDLAAGKLKAGAGNKAIPPVVSMTTSGLGDGLFLLTSKPSLWFYRFEDDSLTEQFLALGDWPKGRSIASYNSNLYLLADDSSQIYKFGRTLSGFNGRSNYLGTAELDSLKGTTAIAVDGAIIASGSDGLRRYVAGILKQSNSQLPSEITHPSSMRSFADGSLFLMTDQTTGRVGLLSLENDALVYKKQYQFDGLQTVLDTAPDSKNSLLYILADGKLYKAALTF